jgi:hypothetical protein
MNWSRALRLSLAPLLLAAANAQSWYDGNFGTLPSAQGWNYAALPGLAQQSQTGSAVRLITGPANGESAGYAKTALEPLDRQAGLNLAFRFRLNAEAHARTDRAGFSIIALASDRRGIELGFWTNLVFAQSDQPLFTHAEEAAFDFRQRFIDLTLTLGRTNYLLFAEGEALLSGPVRNYTAFSGLFDVYETPNFVFMGDDTTSASAEVEIVSVTLIRPPVLRPSAPGVVEWTGVAGQTYRVLSSPDLQTWSVLDRVTSDSGQFRFVLGDQTSPARFLRVEHPG